MRVNRGERVTDTYINTQWHQTVLAMKTQQVKCLKINILTETLCNSTCTHIQTHAFNSLHNAVGTAQLYKHMCI